MGEMTLAAYRKQHGMRSVACRLFTAYGERENETHAVIALIAKTLVRMNPYEIWGDGQQDRNFTYIGDFVDGMIRAAETIDDGSPVNIGRAEHIKIIDMVRLIFAEIGFEPEVIEFDTSNACGRLQPRRGPRPRAGAARLGIQDDLRRRAPSHNPLVLRDTQCLGGGLPAWGAAHEALKHCGEVRSF